MGHFYAAYGGDTVDMEKMVLLMGALPLEIPPRRQGGDPCGSYCRRFLMYCLFIKAG